MNLRQLREQAGMTQDQLADATGLHQTTVSQLETGRNKNPEYRTVSAIAKALNTTADVVADAIAQTEAA